MTRTSTSPESRQAHLLASLRDCVAPSARLLVAYSGGVDSAYLAWAAHQALGAGMLAVLADSPSLPRKHRAEAAAFAAEYGFPLQIVHTREMDSEAYTRNDAQRCYHCKDELFRVMEQFAARHTGARLAYGRNVDDAGDFRPGQRAAAEHAVLAPLADAGLTKADIRHLAQAAGLRVWNKPAAACLASRVEHKREVSAEVLGQIEAAEDALQTLGFRQLRVRHHGEMARIEIERGEMAGALTLEMLDRITDAVRAAGFRHVGLDTAGYRSGSMNTFLPLERLVVRTGIHAAG